jgi:hypothetical protein
MTTTTDSLKRAVKVRWQVWRTSSFAPYVMEPITQYPTRKRAQAHVDILTTSPRYVGTNAEVRRIIVTADLETGQEVNV